MNRTDLEFENGKICKPVIDFFLDDVLERLEKTLDFIEQGKDISYIETALKLNINRLKKEK